MVDYKIAKGWLRDDEREALKQLAEGVTANGVIINIGVEYGASIACFRAGNPLCDIIGVDIDMSTLVNETYLDCEPLLLEGDSGSDWVFSNVGELVDWKEHKHADLLFIDGDHTYHGVLHDTRYCDLVGVGGIVVFHDYYDWSDPEKGVATDPWVTGVSKAVDQWIDDSNDNWEELPRAGTMRIFKKKS